MAMVMSLRTPDGREYSVAGVLRIGRATENEICLTGDDLLSRLHARVWPDGERVFIRDEGSSNGTHVNGHALAAGEIYRLRPGDSVRVGATTFTVAARSSVRAVTGPLPVAGVAVPPPVVQKPVIQPPSPAPLAAPPAPAAPAPSAAAPSATRIEQGPFAAQAPAASHRTRNLLLGGCLVLIVLAICGGLVVIGLTAGRAPIATALAQVGGAPTPARGTPAATPSPGGAIPATPAATSRAFTFQVLPTVPSPSPLAPAGYAANSLAVAAALADLNAAQLHFIHDNAAGAPPGPAAMDELLIIAADSYKLGVGAEGLCQASAVQAGASAAAEQVAGLYAGLARYGYAQALDAQNLRAGLAAGKLDVKTAAARVAGYGARAWNPSVTDPAKADNPFLPLLATAVTVPTPTPLSAAGAAALQTGLGAQASLQTWIAAPAQPITLTVAFPAPIRPLGDPQDPALLASLITPAGQADADRASQADVAGLQRLGATLPVSTGSHSPAKGADLVTLANAQAGGQVMSYADTAAVILTADQKPAGQALPSFPGGTGAALAKKAPAAAGGDDAFINNVFGSGPDNTPTKTGDTPITDAAPLVTLTITNIQIGAVNKLAPGGTFEANVQFSFDVSWATSLGQPLFTLNCVGSNQKVVSTASGTFHVQATGSLILYPGEEIAYCYANSNSGSSLGNVSISILVGDSAAATERANQVETDSAALNLTLTADAQNTQAQATQQAAQTQAVLQTQNALETEQAASQTAEFRATITQIAHLTEVAAAAASETPSPTPTFVPVLLETLEHPGDQFAVTTKTVLQPNRLYQFCFSGTVNLINPDRAAKASDIDHVNGVAVPLSGCMVVEGNGKAAVISCGSGEVAQDPGGFTIQVVDLGPA